VSRAFHQRVALMNSTGQHVRYVPGAMAHAMVLGGAAHLEDTAGRVRAVTLARPAASFARTIGPPTEGGMSVRFTRWRRLDESAARVIEHHPRCLYALDWD
jgi:hypothetical protein